MKNGKPESIPLYRALLNKDNLTFSTRRLLKDLEEVKCNNIPLANVSACNLEDDLFLWHVNIRGPEDTPYAGGVFHLELKIPYNYPYAAPVIHTFNDLPHPNIFSKKICLNMLEKESKLEFGIKQWNSEYSIMSILIQLQGLLFEKCYNYEDKQIKKAIEQANEFECAVASCKHRGKHGIYPAFVNAQDLNKFKTLESEKTLFEKDLFCFHTHISHKENHLGLGILVNRELSTNLIKRVSPSTVYISIKAFIKEGIRITPFSENFNYWLPLYFGTDKERTLHFARRSISMICTGNTRQFKEEMIINLMPNIISELVSQIVNKNCCTRILRLLTHIQFLYMTLLDEYPKLYENIESMMSNFLKKEDHHRHKKIIPSLEAFISNILISSKYDIKKIIKYYVDEQLDRQVSTFINSIEDFNKAKEGRNLIAFNLVKTSNHMTLFYYMLVNYLKNKFKAYNNLYKYYHENYGVLFTQYENEIQNKFLEISNINSYEEYYEYLGIGKLDDNMIHEKLNLAVKNSENKGYHGFKGLSY